MDTLRLRSSPDLKEFSKRKINNIEEINHQSIANDFYSTIYKKKDISKANNNYTIKIIKELENNDIESKPNLSEKNFIDLPKNQDQNLVIIDINDKPNKINDINFVLSYDPITKIGIKKFVDIRPQKNYDTYFTKPYQTNEAPAKNGLAIGIPFFNEPSHELQQTLHSLQNNWEMLCNMSQKWKNKPLYICLIQDGWQKADQSMKKYLQKLFPCKVNEENWWEAEEFKENYEGPDFTFLFEKDDYDPIIINPQKAFESNRISIKLTLIIKINNRKKHNSHEWFLGKNGFSETLNTEYLFMTDAFTLFSKTCLYHLINYLDKNPCYSAVTGRQRLMSRDQQGGTESVFSLGYLLRMVQLFDFELANAVYNGAFSLGGMLPVIPGPCGMFRAEDVLQDKVRDWYFGIVNEEPDKTGLILGNLRIAEDRIWSFASVIKTKDKRFMAFNPLAIFYFEAETELQKFILQRRRWINGSVAGYIYLLFTSIQDFNQWDTGIIRKIYIWFLLMCQFMIYFMVSISPGISIKILYYGINYFLEFYNVKFGFNFVIIGIIFWAIFLAHLFIHNRIKFNYTIMYMLLLLSFATSIISFGSLFHYAFIYEQKSFIEIILNGGIILYLGLFVFIFPFILALLLSGRGHSLMYMIKSFIPYMLFMHMLIAWFGSYSYSRIWDLSWGNRPASELSELSKEKREFLVKKFKEKSIKVLIGIIIINLVVFFTPLAGQLIIMSIFFGIATFQMLFSFIFCITKIYYKIKYVYVKTKINYENKKQNKSIDKIHDQV